MRKFKYERTLEEARFLDCVGGWTNERKRLFINYREHIFEVDAWDGVSTAADIPIAGQFDSVEAAIAFVELETANGQ